jgi:sec-independent protein translocase protein TatB
VFNLQGSELVIILLLALVVLGPEKLPEAMRKLGEFYAQLKKMSTGFQQEFRAATEEPAREIREMSNTLRDSLDFRKLSTGEREEKPKTAEMAPADPTQVPTEAVPFRPVDVAPEVPVDVAPEPPVEAAVEAPVEPPVEAAVEPPVVPNEDA